MEFTLVHIVFFLNNGGEILKEHLEHLEHSWTYNIHKEII